MCKPTINQYQTCTRFLVRIWHCLQNQLHTMYKSLPRGKGIGSVATKTARSQDSGITVVNTENLVLLNARHSLQILRLYWPRLSTTQDHVLMRCYCTCSHIHKHKGSGYKPYGSSDLGDSFRRDGKRSPEVREQQEAEIKRIEATKKGNAKTRK